MLKIASYTYITNSKQQSIHKNTQIYTETNTTGWHTTNKQLTQIHLKANINNNKHKIISSNIMRHKLKNNKNEMEVYKRFARY